METLFPEHTSKHPRASFWVDYDYSDDNRSLMYSESERIVCFKTGLNRLEQRRLPLLVKSVESLVSIER